MRAVRHADVDERLGVGKTQAGAARQRVVGLHGDAPAVVAPGVSGQAGQLGGVRENPLLAFRPGTRASPK
jgi:hypothetical protein